MKTYLTRLPAFILIMSFSISFSACKKEGSTQKKDEMKNAVESPVISTNTHSATNLMPESSVQTNKMADVLKTVVNLQTGEYAAADSSRQTLSLKDKDGNEIWSTNLVKRFMGMSIIVTDDGKQIQRIPAIENPEITSVASFTNGIEVWIANTFFVIDKQTGKIIRWGAR